MSGAGGTGLQRLDRWLAELPGGLESYPQAQAKGSIVRSLLAGQPVPDLAARLPAQVGRLATDPPVGSEWVPEVHFAALLLGIADVRGMSDAAVCAWARAHNRALFESPAYRILMEVMAPGALVRFAGKRWENWHRGTRLEVDGVSDDGVRLTLTFPARLYDALLLRVFGEAFAAALELSKATSPQVTIEESDPGSARYLAQW